MRELKKDFFDRDAEIVARGLLGKLLRFDDCSGVIVETEAYKDDPASHARKITKRSRPIAEKFGTTYVYLNYGMYWLLNFTCDSKKAGAVLIRAVEPVEGIPLMRKRRKREKVEELCSGPGKLCQAFGITGKQHDKPVRKEVMLFDIGRKVEIATSKRVGISKGQEYEWRYFIKGNRFVSKG
jgi:DNA-3-methyladenine glycosylase